MADPKIVIQTEEHKLVDAINRSQTSEDVVYTVLKTDERVIARVTDGIYRQPASALRELISNAYDADASKVVIKTDAPRFSRISVEDNGHGMTPKALGNMLMHIGGSAKRNNQGAALGITNEIDNDLSPNGRKLIGKIGIGIFSVAQLTYNFQIITKTKGDNFRTIAVVNLRQYSDESAEIVSDIDQFESGRVSVWREKAIDIDVHGTTIILNNIRPQARNTLQSREVWSAVEQSEDNTVTGDLALQPPKYHIGKVDATGKIFREANNRTSTVPWLPEDKPNDAFAKLVDVIWQELENSNPNPQLDKLFDYYLQMVWNLSLAIPAPYVQGDLFDMQVNHWSDSYLISNEPKGQPTEIDKTDDRPIREILNLQEGTTIQHFEVFIDDLQLLRPIKYLGLPTGGHALKKPLILFGKCREEFNNYQKELSGGPLDFEAYLFWTPKIAPTEHRGSLIRINGSSGTLFDPTFFRYQIAEQTRLKQITCEIFVHEGIDSALNIDRESFNFAHPHSAFLTRWLHSALRQLATTNKKIASEVRSGIRGESIEHQKTEIQQIAFNVWQRESKDEFSNPPIVAIKDQQEPVPKSSADIVVVKSPIKNIIGRRSTSANSQFNSEKMIAITQILASFGLLEKLTQQQQDRLLNAIYNVLESTE
ncbi:ATP-binding protein [Dyadobacter fanqingshengii]|uniref:ATP-binding protein n=1 Tax=Dyadobacter fanqingshengii TaxID=2906443 RepID=A0A9X1PAU5_9BACT|nr:ATP-binding protein [Dyadobacter fanqingshengii]MCF0041561.1 ATP-binding protein [Dyadobacter fanqingshengii]USJ36722.1 ATP-binding protein [Dyadobacter fanqingshengii]